MVVSLMEFRVMELQTLQNRRGDLDRIEVINFPAGFVLRRPLVPMLVKKFTSPETAHAGGISASDSQNALVR